MPKVCDISGKKTQVGNNVSHANNKTKRKFYPNLHKKKFYIPEKDIWILMKVSTSTMRTINKNGLLRTMLKAKERGTLNRELWEIATI